MDSPSFAYWDAVIAERSVMLTEQESLEGNTTVSIETQADLSEAGVCCYIEDNFFGFMQGMESLSQQDRELLLSYYVLGQTQQTMARVYRTTQTLCSTLVRTALARLGAQVMLGDFSQEVLKTVFTKYGVETGGEVSIPLSSLVAEYARCRSFQSVADKFNQHRPAVRRTISKATVRLGKIDEPRAQAITSYLRGLLDKASAGGQGLSQRQMLKTGPMYLETPDILGEFVVDITNPDFGQLLTSRANRV